MADSKCAQCGTTAAPLSACSRCKSVLYCGTTCQIKHWRAGGHKTLCRPATLSTQQVPNNDTVTITGVEAATGASVSKKAPLPEGSQCANCSAQDGDGVRLKPCSRCKLVSYCGKACQTPHWKGGHRQLCVPIDQRKPAPVSILEQSSKTMDAKCTICLSLITDITACILPCAHRFHGKCVEGFESSGASRSCPICRADIPLDYKVKKC